MIADYLYNTPSLTTETGAFVLLTQQFANGAALNSALLGKTLAQIRELPSVLGTADTEVKQFGFLQRRNPSSVYAGSTILPNFTVPTSAKFDIVRGGQCQALAMIILKDGVCLRAVSMALRLNAAAEVSATRTAFSVDDDFVSAIEGPLGVGLMLGKMSKALRDVYPDSTPSVIALSMSKALRDVEPLSGPTVMPAPMITTLRDPTPPLTPTDFPPSMLRTLRDVAPTSS